jgi:alkylhydroperoxidase/carboxymuconolactone decarboxylase family protein YurZ
MRTLKPSVDDREDRTRLPRPWARFGERYPDVVAAYDALRDACADTGPLDDVTVALVKLAVSVGGGFDRTVHMHCKKALRAGAAPESLRHIAIIAIPTIGLPRALDALRWVDESIEEMGAERPRPQSADRSACDGATAA